MSPSPHAARFKAAADFGDAPPDGRSGSVSGWQQRGSGRRGLRKPLAALMALIAVATGLVGVSGAVGAAEPIIIYGDELGQEYQDWSWTTVDLSSASEVHGGAASIAVDFGPWEGLYIARPAPMQLTTESTLEFWMHGGSGAAGAIHVVLVDGSHNGGTPVAIETTPGQWTKHALPVSDFGMSGTFGGLWWQNASADARQTVYIDDVRLVGADEERPPTAGGPALTLDLDPRSVTRRITDPASGEVTNQVLSFPHTINSGVYGLNFAAPTLLEELAPGVNRWGGNAVERYNHRNGTTNLGKDWFFMNSPGDAGNDHRFETASEAAGADTLLTMPAIGWMAGDQAARCGYPEQTFGRMDASKNHFLDGNLRCGNGRRGGQVVDGGDPAMTSTPAGTANTSARVADLVNTHGTAADGGVEIYAVGNEPGLWHETHSDVAPTPATREQIIATNIEHAAAIKSADQTAAVAGPVLWGGFSYYVTSAEMAAGQRPGDVPTFVGDYLQSMSAAETAEGRRLLDTLAVNFYDDRVYYGGTDELRLESTRSLWDPSYAPSDWWVVRDFVGEGNAVIPRMKSLIDSNYPGTELSITEYNFGALDTLAGGLTQADALGIFGREGVDRAILWDPFNEQLSPPEHEFANTPAMWAYRMFRNYDGNRSRFGDRSLFANSEDQDVLSVYGAQRSQDGAITVMVINKSTNDQISTLTAPVAGSAEVYNYGSNDLVSIERLEDLAIDRSVTTTYPARSITLLVIDPSTEGPTPPTAPPAPSSTTSNPTRTTTVAPGPPTTATPGPTTSPTTNPTSNPTSSAPTEGSVAFAEDFASDRSMTRFETGLYHRDDWVVTTSSWAGDHQSTGPNDACGSPHDKRIVERGDRSSGFNDDWIYRCRPGGDAAKAHLMTSIGDTSGYSIGAFTPRQKFSDVKEVRWDVNITDLGARQFPEVKIVPVRTFDFQNLPCSIDWLPCETDRHAILGSVGTSFFHGEPAIHSTVGFVKGNNWDAGYRSTANDPARASITTRRTHFLRDNGDGTLTFGIEKADGAFETVSAPGSFPDGDVRVVFADHNYTPTKDEPADLTFSWHWDDLRIMTASGSGAVGDPAPPDTTVGPTTTVPISTTSTAPPSPDPTTKPVQPPGGLGPCVPGIPAGAIDGQPQFIGCRALGQATDTAQPGKNSWLDDFDHGQSFTDLQVPSYRMFDDLGVQGTVHWGHANHWMVDVATSGETGGAMLSPNQTFSFEDGMLVIEADAAARHPDNVNAWPELVISTGDRPGALRRDGLYGYDHFKGEYTLGCRLQLDSAIICSLMDDSSGTQIGGGRIWEMSWFQHVGTDVFGGASFADGGRFFRACEPGKGDAACRDRFRLELTENSLTMYVNGFKYFEQTGVPSLPDELLNGDLHVYFGSMVSRHPNDAIRFHWDRVAVNPSTGPSPSSTFTMPN